MHGGSTEPETFSFTMRMLFRSTRCWRPPWEGLAVSKARRTSSSLGGSNKSVVAPGRLESEGDTLDEGLVGAGGGSSNSFESKGDGAEKLEGGNAAGLP